MHGLIEALGGFVIILGLGAMAGAAAMVSPELGVLATGVALVLIGFTVVYLASVLEQRSAGRPKAGDRP